MFRPSYNGRSMVLSALISSDELAVKVLSVIALRREVTEDVVIGCLAKATCTYQGG
jgi:hypothetical protein